MQSHFLDSFYILTFISIPNRDFIIRPYLMKKVSPSSRGGARIFFTSSLIRAAVENKVLKNKNKLQKKLIKSQKIKILYKSKRIVALECQLLEKRKKEEATEEIMKKVVTDQMLLEKRKLEEAEEEVRKKILENEELKQAQAQSERKYKGRLHNKKTSAIWDSVPIKA